MLHLAGKASIRRRPVNSALGVQLGAAKANHSPALFHSHESEARRSAQSLFAPVIGARPWLSSGAAARLQEARGHARCLGLNSRAAKVRADSLLTHACRLSPWEACPARHCRAFAHRAA